MVFKLLIILLLPLSLFSQKDYSRDKHMLASAGINIVSTEICFQITKKQGLSIAVGTATSFLVGYLKERVYDKEMGKGTYSTLDLRDNAWGNITAIPVMVVRFDLYNKKQQELKTW